MLNKSERILFSIFFLLSSLIIIYNIFYIPAVPNADIIKKEVFIQEQEQEQEKDTKNNNKIASININSAGIEELKKIPGIGEATAQKIIEYREQNGGFFSKEEIMNVSGIGEKKFENMKDYIKIN